MEDGSVVVPEVLQKHIGKEDNHRKKVALFTMNHKILTRLVF